jgi:hypothetical protein
MVKLLELDEPIEESEVLLADVLLDRVDDVAKVLLETVALLDASMKEDDRLGLDDCVAVDEAVLLVDEEDESPVEDEFMSLVVLDTEIELELDKPLLTLLDTLVLLLGFAVLESAEVLDEPVLDDSPEDAVDETTVDEDDDAELSARLDVTAEPGPVDNEDDEDESPLTGQSAVIHNESVAPCN